MKKVPQKVS